MAPDNEVIIGIRMQLNQLRTDAAEAQKLLKRNFSDAMARSLAITQDKIRSVSNTLRDVYNAPNKALKEQIRLEKFYEKAYVNTANNMFKQSLLSSRGQRIFKEQLKNVNAEMQNSLPLFEKEKLALQRTNDVMKKQAGNFQGWALSIMFFGMALKQMFNTVWQFGTKTFNDIMHSVEGSVTGFDMLNNSVTYLGFVVGQALEPIAAFLAPIIDKISEWISNNETLFTTILIVVGVLGTVLTLVGGIVLGVAGLVSAWAIAGPFITGALAAVAGAFLPIIAVIGVVILLIALWKTNFGGLKDFIVETFTSVWEFLKSIWNNIGGIFSGFIKIVKGIFTGDFDTILEGAKELVLNFIALIIKAFMGLGAIIVNVWRFAMNLVIDIVATSIKLIIGAFAKAAELVGLDDLAGKIKAGIKAVSEVQANIRNDYITGDQVAAGLGGIDKFLGTGSTSTTNSTTIINNNITASTIDQSLLDRINSEIGARTP